MVKVCYGGCDYIFNFFIGYFDEFFVGVQVGVGFNFNFYFFGIGIVMVCVLYDGLVEYEDDIFVIIFQMVKDVIEFFNWVVEFEMDDCKCMGMKVLVIIFVLFVMSVWVKWYKWVWFKLRKIVYDFFKEGKINICC